MKKKEKRMPILITSAINVSAGQTALHDSNQRLRLTIGSLDEWRTIDGAHDIVVCDGSGFDLTPHLKEITKNANGLRVEILNFNNDIEKVHQKGKGYGEGEIVNYALRNSEILKNAKDFAKCTGKLWVSNYKSCLMHFNGTAAFDFNGKLKPNKIDTRFYMVSKKFYISNLSSLHLKTDDNKGFNLEHSFRDGLNDFPFHEYVMYPTPRICGFSGSMNKAYEVKPVRSLIKDARSKLIQFIKLR